MREMLFLAHRFPYPPDKGEKIRSWNLIRHLARSWRVHLGCLSDNPDDARHMDAVREVCGEVACFAVRPRMQKLRAVARLRPGRPMMVDYYGHAGLAAWVRRMQAERDVALRFACSTPMAEYFLPGGPGRLVLDMVDVDSEKFATYGREGTWPMRLVWRREARTLLAYETRAVLAADLALLVSEPECARFAALAPATRGRVVAVNNGVDLDYFHPGHRFASPYGDAAPRLVFTGHMDYPPNAEAASWFAGQVMPLLRARRPAPVFTIVGANPTPAVRALAALPGVEVTGRVADVRPFLAGAAVAVAPLRVARGIQNKVLEAMAMGRPVVASPQAFEGLVAIPGRDVLVADGAEAMAARVAEVLDGRHPGLGQAARAMAEQGYSWDGVFAGLDTVLAGVVAKDGSAPEE
ncbi:MAG: TIGR03087 family PEP-CTERM/XrtA system glycosyltransferase [Acetobacteraceae bacterium]|nr:TIGR03087 family PEP-CTERM/XrtA system glycosyltransferase [Acetobacteraceae bacterium]